MPALWCLILTLMQSDVPKYSKKAQTRAFFLLKAPGSAFTHTTVLTCGGTDWLSCLAADAGVAVLAEGGARAAAGGGGGGARAGAAAGAEPNTAVNMVTWQGEQLNICILATFVTPV